MSVPEVLTPRRLYVHDDLTGEIGSAYGPGSDELALATALLDCVRRDGPHVTILTLEEQLDALVSRTRHEPFDVAIGIGRAGERVARQVHERSGWFPHVRCVGLTREELPGGGYRVVATDGSSLRAAVGALRQARAIAVVDDTIFSGLTMSTVLSALSPETRARTHAFCLRAIGESLARVAALAPVTAGFVATGRIDVDASFINASGLVRRGSIRRAGQPPMAFFERPAWIRAWFPASADRVIALSRSLNARLERGPACA